MSLKSPKLAATFEELSNSLEPLKEKPYISKKTELTLYKHLYNKIPLLISVALQCYFSGRHLSTKN